MESIDIQSVLFIILLVSAIALCIALIIYLNRITKSINQIESDVSDVSKRVRPLIKETIEVSSKINEISDEAREQINVTRNIVYDIKDRVDIILEFEQKLRRGIEEPADQLIKNLSAISNGVNTFWKTYKNKH